MRIALGEAVLRESQFETIECGKDEAVSSATIGAGDTARTVQGRVLAFEVRFEILAECVEQQRVRPTTVAGVQCATVVLADAIQPSVLLGEGVDPRACVRQ